MRAKGGMEKKEETVLVYCDEQNLSKRNSWNNLPSDMNIEKRTKKFLVTFHRLGFFEQFEKA